MIRKALICPYFGDQPEWIGRYWANAERLEGHGYDFLLDTNESDFRDRVHDKLGIVCPPMWGSGKVWDFRPALGFLYVDEIRDFDWWGHTDFDCVYGRVEEFVTDAKLDACDIYTDCAHGYLAGPWTLYRNEERINHLFLKDPEWQQNMTDPEPTGWIEESFSRNAKTLVTVTVENNHAYDEPEHLRMVKGRLFHDRPGHFVREIPFFHFRRSKVWPL